MVAADASAQFGKLIDEWIAAYPIERCSLTLADLRLVAGAILLMETSGSVPRLASSARVVAIMFVLFVREGVEVATPPHEPEILGVGMWKSFGMLHKIIVKAELSHSDFVEAVVENDLHGESIELAQSSDIISALFAQSICSEEVQRRTPLRLNLRALLANMPTARLLVRAHALLVVGSAVLVTAWFISATSGTAPGAWMHAFTTGVLLAMACNITLFPHRLETPAGTRFVLPQVVCHYVGGLLYCYNGLTQHAATYSRACFVVYLVHCTIYVCNGGLSLLLLLFARERYTWTVYRALLAVDGLQFVSVAVALRLIGPPPSDMYPPIGVSFAICFRRGLATLLLAMALTARVRVRIAGALRPLLGWVLALLGVAQMGFKRIGAKIDALLVAIHCTLDSQANCGPDGVVTAAALAQLDACRRGD